MKPLVRMAPGLSPGASGFSSRIGAALALALIPAMASAAPPSAGTIQQQALPPASLPTAPGPALELPAPAHNESETSERIAVSRIVLQGNTLISTEALAPLLMELGGKTLSLADLERAAARITQRYRDAGYSLAYALLPAQTIQDGVVTIAVIEPRYDQIEVKGDSRLRPAQARRTLGLREGAIIQDVELERGLLLLSQTPGIRVQGSMLPGSQAGTSSLQTRVADTPLLSGSLGLDNYGSPSTGRSRGTLQASLNNALGYGEQLSLNGLNTEGGLLHSGGGTLSSGYLWQGLRLSAYGSYTDYQLGGRFAALAQTGRAAQWGASLSWPVLLRTGLRLEARFDALQNLFAQRSKKVGLDDRYRISLQRLSLNGAFADSGQGVNAGALTLSFGEKTIDSLDAFKADAAGPRTDGNFWVAQLQLQRTQLLPLSFRLQGSLNAQTASRNLDGSQKLYLGGPQGVMNLAVGEAGGDAGMLSRVQLDHALPLPLPGALSAGLLLQGGKIWLDHARYAGAAARQQRGAAAAGLELSYRYADKMSFVLDYAHRLNQARSPGDEALGGELWAGLQINY